MKPITALLIALTAVLAACGDNDESSAESATTTAAPAAQTQTEAPADTTAEKPAAKPAAGKKIVLAGSDFGDMLYDSKKQAIYIFEKDSKNKSNCYGECAKAWPPVYTKGEPQAADGVKQSLLGTTKRKDGKTQVTYRGQPLYYYDHEGPNEVLCHNVNLNGGLWWVVGANGKRRP